MWIRLPVGIDCAGRREHIPGAKAPDFFVGLNVRTKVRSYLSDKSKGKNNGNGNGNRKSEGNGNGNRNGKGRLGGLITFPPMSR
jgi:hypothetical protein